MTITTLYASTTAAGTGDGSTWANRAALLSSGAFASFLTGFNFTTSSVELLIGPGTYTVSTTLGTGSFTHAPSIAFPLVMRGCDSSGNPLVPANPGWVSAQPDFDDSAYPVITTTTNISTVTIGNCTCSCIKFTGSGNTSTQQISGATSLDWCSLYYTGAGGAGLSGVVHPTLRLTNSLISMGTTAFSCALSIGTSGVPATHDNVRLRGNGTANTGSGNRHGIVWPSFGSGCISRICVYAFDGCGLVSTSTNVNDQLWIDRCTIANCRGSVIQCNPTASQTTLHFIRNCMLTGGGTTSGTGYGVDGQTNANVILSNCRLDRNASGNTTAIGSWPTDVNNYTTSDTDANEYVSAGTGSTADFRIKSNATNIWGKGYGAGDEPASAGEVSYAFAG